MTQPRHHGNRVNGAGFTEAQVQQQGQRKINQNVCPPWPGAGSQKGSWNLGRDDRPAAVPPGDLGRPRNRGATPPRPRPTRSRRPAVVLSPTPSSKRVADGVRVGPFVGQERAALGQGLGGGGAIQPGGGREGRCRAGRTGLTAGTPRGVRPPSRHGQAASPWASASASTARLPAVRVRHPLDGGPAVMPSWSATHVQKLFTSHCADKKLERAGDSVTPPPAQLTPTPM